MLDEKMGTGLMHILMNMPDPGKEGGVTQFCQTLKPFFAARVSYFVVGARRDGEGLFRSLLRMVADYLSFWRRLGDRSIGLVQLNPSLGTRAVVRDGIFLLLAKCRGKRVVVFNHGWAEECESLIRKRFPRLYPAVFSRADAFVVLASSFAEKLRDLGLRTRISLETTAVSEEIFALGERSFSLFLNRQGREGITILFLSRMEKEKGISEALDAFAIFQRRHPDAVLICAGDGSALGQARAQAARLGLTGVEFPGFVTGEDKDRVLSRADLYLFPSWSEGMPISVLEAMAYGIPVVTTKVGGIQDFFQDGDMGLLTESRKPQVLAELLDALARDPVKRRAMGERNFAFSREHFRPARVVARLEALYRSVINGNLNRSV